MKKTKILTRIMALLMCLLMMLSIFSCKKEEHVDKNTESNSVNNDDGEEKLELPNVNYGGELFTILGRSGDNGEWMKDLDISELTVENDQVDKAVYQRNKKVEDTYGVDIVLLTQDVVALNNTVINTVGAGDDSYDLIATHGRYVFDHIIANRASEIHDFRYIDLEKSWWLDNLEDVWTTPGGKLFAVNGDISYMYLGCMGGIYFNKDVLNQANIDLPYDYVRNDTWYYSTFKKMVIDADASVNGDGSGIIGQDTIAYVTERFRGPGTVIDSTGIPPLVKGGDGKYSIGVKDQKVYDAADDYMVMLQKPYSGMASSVEEMRNAFKKGKAVFVEDNLKEAPRFKQAGVDFGLVPIYKYDDSVGDLGLCVGSGTNTFMIPITVPETDREMIGVVVEAMAYYGQKYMIPVYYDKILSYQSMQSPDDLEMLHRIRDAARIDLAEYLNPGDIKGTLFNSIESGVNYATVVAGLGKSVWIDLDTWYALDNQQIN